MSFFYIKKNTVCQYIVSCSYYTRVLKHKAAVCSYQETNIQMPSVQGWSFIFYPIEYNNYHTSNIFGITSMYLQRWIVTIIFITQFYMVLVFRNPENLLILNSESMLPFVNNTIKITWVNYLLIHIFYSYLNVEKLFLQVIKRLLLLIRFSLSLCVIKN